MVGLAGEHAVERLDRAIAVTLRRVDLRERDGRQGRGGARVRDGGKIAPDRADPLGRVGQVQAALDDAREEIAGAAEEAARSLLGRLVGRAAEEQLVDELRPGEDARPGDARSLGARDEGVAVQPFELDTVHPPVMGQRRRRCKGAVRSPAARDRVSAARASATSRAICALSSSSEPNFFSSRSRATR